MSEKLTPRSKHEADDNLYELTANGRLREIESEIAAMSADTAVHSAILRFIRAFSASMSNAKALEAALDDLHVLGYTGERLAGLVVALKAEDDARVQQARETTVE